MKEQLLEKAIQLREVLTKCATGQDNLKDAEDYLELRQLFYSNLACKKLLPNFLVSNRILSDFWLYIKKEFPTYQERREFLRQEFESLFSFLEESSSYDSDDAVSTAITNFDCDSVIYMWNKALERRTIDPDGAITAARSLIESVCKQILLERNCDYDDNMPLPKLFKETALCLNITPEQHDDVIFKQILGGMQSTIHGFATLRNSLGDAHGKPKGSYRPSSRHAELAVNLSGTFACYLIRTHQETLVSSTSN